RVVGYLEGGLASLQSHPELTATTERLSPATAAERLAAKQAIAVDVRSPGERAQKAIENSLGVPLNQLSRRLGELPRTPLVVYCAGGYRSSMAASLLQQHGFSVSEIAGGITAWEAADLPTGAIA